MRAPILFVIFNRPDTTKMVFEAIRSARPEKLYIAADGPRLDLLDEKRLCDETRQIALTVDWNCQVHTLLRNNNLGCKNAVSSAISWFFQNEVEGIILEDDCLPSNSFFQFCEEMLDRFRADLRIWHITGNNIAPTYKQQAIDDFYFTLSYGGSIWGWATWRDRWKYYSKDLSDFEPDEFSSFYQDLISPKQLKARLENFKMIKSGFDTWDYQWAYCRIKNNGLSIVPRMNMIENIGFDERATHTKNKSPNTNSTRNELYPPYNAPKYIGRNTSFENFVFESIVEAEPSLTKKVKSLLKGFLH